MPRLNRIVGFLSVSFVLLFVAKINKVELYTAYFRTIADVEIRNSQAVYAPSDFATVAELPAAPKDAPASVSASGALHASGLDLDEIRHEHAAKAHALPEQPLILRPHIPQTSPRAPTQAA